MENISGGLQFKRALSIESRKIIPQLVTAFYSCHANHDLNIEQVNLEMESKMRRDYFKHMKRTRINHGISSDSDQTEQ